MRSSSWQGTRLSQASSGLARLSSLLPAEYHQNEQCPPHEHTMFTRQSEWLWRTLLIFAFDIFRLGNKFITSAPERSTAQIVCPSGAVTPLKGPHGVWITSGNVMNPSAILLSLASMSVLWQASMSTLHVTSHNFTLNDFTMISHGLYWAVAYRLYVQSLALQHRPVASRMANERFLLLPR